MAQSHQIVNKIALPSKDGFEYVHLSHLLYVQASGNYSKATLQDKKTVYIFKSLKMLEEQLSPYGFIRIHHEYIINLYHLTRYIKSDGGCVQMSDGRELEVSRGKKKEFLRIVRGGTM